MIDLFINLNSIGLSNELLPGFLNTLMAYLTIWVFIGSGGFIILISWDGLAVFFREPKKTLVKLAYGFQPAFQDTFGGGDNYFKALVIIWLVLYPLLFFCFFSFLYFINLSGYISEGIVYS